MVGKIDLNRVFVKKLISLAVPLFLQSVAMSLLSFIDVIMVGQLGDTVVAGVGIGNQINFIRIILTFGTALGVGVFIAQYWGAKDIGRLHRFQGIGLALSLLIGIVFSLFSIFFPRLIISLYSDDPGAIMVGSGYIRILGISFIINSVAIIFSQVLRSTENVKIPLFSSVLGFGLNTLLNYLLIFGNFGFPRLGYQGAAIATVISRFVEAGFLLVVTYVKRLPTASSLRQLIDWDLRSVVRFFRIGGPIILHNGFWIIGVNIYTMVYGKVSTEALAAFYICKSFESVSNMLFSAFGNSSGIMLGNRLGAGEFETARTYAYNFFFLEFLVAAFFAAVFILGRPVFVMMYNLSDTSVYYLSVILVIFGLFTFPKAGNIVLNMGILRSGGDTTFAMFLDLGAVWLYGVPMAFIGAFVLKLPVYIVIGLVSLEEVIKFTVGYLRFKSGRWLRNLTE
ncbi:MAG: MATE family efflux transporter [Spirochaetales bacterium]|nr:MATE family efflux transporter [Spirochaetales bacterium]